MSPLFLDAPQVVQSLPWVELVDALQEAFAGGEVCSPPRTNHALEPGSPQSPQVLLMPAWSPRLGVGTKLVTVFPGNARIGLPSVNALYVLADQATGRMLAVIDGEALTARRTAAASALASRHLSRPDSRTLLMIGTGRLARELPLAHAAVRPIEQVLVWGRNAEHAQETARALSEQGLRATVASALPEAAAQADIVSCATLSDRPLLQGEWLRPGTHVDLVGAFTPTMCEADPRVFARADAVWCDSAHGAAHEAGDILQAVEAGAFSLESLRGDLARLCREGAQRQPADITVFKSVGLALEDLVAARMCFERQSAQRA